MLSMTKGGFASVRAQGGQGVRPLLTGSDIPLVLAAIELLESIYRSVNTYSNFAEPASRAALKAKPTRNSANGRAQFWTESTGTGSRHGGASSRLASAKGGDYRYRPGGSGGDHGCGGLGSRLFPGVSVRAMHALRLYLACRLVKLMCRL
jgi:Bacterial archaeo-eukaryotic release factor family 11